MNIAVIGSAVTVVSMIAFAGIAWLAYAPRYKKKHEEDGMIPFLDSQTPSVPSADGDDKTRI
ncbi:Cbb3-type cytochrome oxidase component FixQ [mine drainage metagenome]|jgi:cytochrome c oxidase cbb3-type subunit 4|uniref:Cbb3-type cytochrome oxidase component FixQ n=1 Tax=mine drainage metagenome TaxID=410659 RepID=A0A1J5QHV4_9ZZZZ